MKMKTLTAEAVLHALIGTLLLITAIAAGYGWYATQKVSSAAATAIEDVRELGISVGRLQGEEAVLRRDHGPVGAELLRRRRTGREVQVAPSHEPGVAAPQEAVGEELAVDEVAHGHAVGVDPFEAVRPERHGDEPRSVESLAPLAGLGRPVRHAELEEVVGLDGEGHHRLRQQRRKWQRQRLRAPHGPQV